VFKRFLTHPPRRAEAVPIRREAAAVAEVAEIFRGILRIMENIGILEN
jgi:hypothetical protein